jgi:uncharacterized protein (DUF1810 family)
MHDDLQHFVAAQESVFACALQELRAGRKRSHWMWFIFPQLDGLGRSETARRFAVQDLDHARRYLQHPVLGPRLVQATQAAQAALADDIALIDLFGPVDAQKFISCMTLFAQAAAEDSIFAQALAGLQASDGTTLEMLGEQGRADRQRRP